MKSTIDMMNKQANEICEIKISKAGRNLFARIPDRYMNLLGKGDKVKISLVEKAPNDEKIIPLLKKFIKNPNGNRLRGSIEGYPVSIPTASLINALGKEKAEKLLLDAIKVPPESRINKKRYPRRY